MKIHNILFTTLQNGKSAELWSFFPACPVSWSPSKLGAAWSTCGSRCWPGLPWRECVSLVFTLAVALCLYLLVVLIWKPLRAVFVTHELNMFLLAFREPQGIIACCNPVPPLVRQQINEMHLLIQQAREMPLLKVRSFPAESRPVLSVSILLPYSL